MTEVKGIHSESDSPTVTPFSPEASAAIERRGLRVFDLTGKSLEAITRETRKRNRWFQYNMYLYVPNRNGSFFYLPSRKSQVAINPKQIYIPGSNEQPLDKQLRMLDEYKETIIREIPDVDVIMGTISDNAELAKLCNFGVIRANDGAGFRNTPVYARSLTTITHKAKDEEHVRYLEIGANCIREHLAKDAEDNTCVVPLIIPKASVVSS